MIRLHKSSVNSLPSNSGSQIRVNRNICSSYSNTRFSLRTEGLTTACALGLVSGHERMRAGNTGNGAGGGGLVWAAVTAPQAGRLLQYGGWGSEMRVPVCLGFGWLPSSWLTERCLWSDLHVAERQSRPLRPLGLLRPLCILPRGPISRGHHTGDFRMPQTYTFWEDTNVIDSTLTVWLSFSKNFGSSRLRI